MTCTCPVHELKTTTFFRVNSFDVACVTTVRAFKKMQKARNIKQVPEATKFVRNNISSRRNGVCHMHK